MAKIQNPHQTLTGITNANFATNYILVDLASQASVVGIVTAAGSPTSATLEYTLDRPEIVVAGSATWVSDATGARLANFGTTALGPVTAVRLNVAASGGTWSLTVAQVYDAGKVN